VSSKDGVARAVSVAPGEQPGVRAALASAGIGVVPVGESTRGLVWMGTHDPAGLAAALNNAPLLEWVQLPSAGSDDFVSAGILNPKITWTSAKGAFSRPVAEHALALTLAILRHFPERSRATTWGKPMGRSLYGLNVVIVGAGGIAQELIRLLAPFGTHVTVVRRQSKHLSGAAESVCTDQLGEVLTTADVVVLAAALTPSTQALIGETELQQMPRSAVLVNVARGGLVDLEALTRAVQDGAIAGAALDVTDPEPLPTGHALWKLPQVLITPHSADTWDMIKPLLDARIVANATHFDRGEHLEGVIDPAIGY
jgi:phosphoglycerate dehydrogenase-like enzyme